MVCTKTVGGAMPLWTLAKQLWRVASQFACLCPHSQDTRCCLPVASLPVPADLLLPLNDPLHDLLVLLCIL